MTREIRNIVVFANGRKIEIPDPSKIIVSVRDCDMRQHQASVDVTVPNVETLKRIVRR